MFNYQKNVKFNNVMILIFNNAKLIKNKADYSGKKYPLTGFCSLLNKLGNR